MNYTKIILCWLSCLIKRFNAGVFGCSQRCGYGALDKVDPYVFVGEMLNVTCTLTEDTVAKGVNSSDLYFHYSVNSNVVQVNETTVINSTSITINKMMTTLYNGAYYCSLRRMVTGITDKCVGMTWVEVEYPPRPAENFTCIIYDWDVYMKCTWDLGAEYGNETNLKVTVVTPFGKCPRQGLRNCTWLQEDGVPFDQTTLMFQVNVTNIKRNVTSSTKLIKIKRDDYVKPSKVNYLVVNSLNSSCVILQWMHQRKFRKKRFIISMNSKWNEIRTIETIKVNETFCDLKPNTLYNFSIETVPATGKGYRSEKVFNTTVTDVYAPDIPPEVVNGAFTSDNKECYRNTRRIVVYWKSIPLEYQNGRMIGYSLSVSNDKGLLYDITINDPNHLYQQLTLPCNQHVKLAITSLGEAGNSSASSVIVIPHHKKINIPKPVIVEALKNSTYTTVNVSWTPIEHDGVTSYTVFFCQYDTECTDELSWIPVGPNYTFVTLDQIQFDNHYRFGVSADFKGFSSGLEWETCYYFKSSIPRPPSTVAVMAHPENSITIDWSDPVCGNSPYIRYYKITWCIADKVTKTCKGPQIKKEIPSTEKTLYVIKDLDAETTYGIRVQFVAGDGRSSDFSEMQLVLVSNNDLLEGEIIGISIAVVFLVLFSIGGVCYIWKTCNRGITQITKPFRIDTIKLKTSNTKGDPSTSISSSISSAVPHTSLDKRLSGDYKQITYVSQLSKDSGQGSMVSDLQSPQIELLSGKLFPVEEELVKRKSADRKYISDLKTKKAYSLDSDYSQIALDSEQIEVTFQIKELPLNTVKSQLHTSSLTAIPQKYSQILDDIMSSTSSINTLGNKSSSEEKILLQLNDDTENGYTDHGSRCNALSAVDMRKSNDDENIDSYVRQEDDIDSNAADSIKDYSYISRDSSLSVNQQTQIGVRVKKFD